MEIQPLTKCKEDGEPYKRPSEVSEQLRTVVQLPILRLLEFARISDRKNPDFILEENLVYLIRQYVRMQNKELVNDLSEILIQRSNKIIKGRLSSLRYATFVDAYNEVIEDLFTRILDISGDRADILQARYLFALKRLTIDKFKKYSRLDNEIILQSELSNKENNLDEGIILGPGHSSATMAPENTYQNKELIAQALNILDKRTQVAFILHHFYGWPLSSKDPNKTTISKRMNVTPKTVYNWLKKADQKIAEWRRENEKS